MSLDQMSPDQILWTDSGLGRCRPGRGGCQGAVPSASPSPFIILISHDRQEPHECHHHILPATSPALLPGTWGPVHDHRVMEDVARRITQIAHLTREFRLRSGAISDHFFDRYMSESAALTISVNEHICVGRNRYRKAQYNEKQLLPYGGKGFEKRS